MSQTVTITLDATDIEGDNLTYRLVSDASNEAHPYWIYTYLQSICKL